MNAERITSCFLDVVEGVSQGSILGPILFTLYVNNMLTRSCIVVTTVTAICVSVDGILAHKPLRWTLMCHSTPPTGPLMLL